MTSYISEEPKGDSCMGTSKEPSEDEEERRVTEKLREREQAS